MPQLLRMSLNVVSLKGFSFFLSFCLSFFLSDLEQNSQCDEHLRSGLGKRFEELVGDAELKVLLKVVVARAEQALKC